MPAAEEVITTPEDLGLPKQEAAAGANAHAAADNGGVAGGVGVGTSSGPAEPEELAEDLKV